MSSNSDDEIMIAYMMYNLKQFYISNVQLKRNLVRKIISSFATRLITCAYPVVVFAKKAFSVEFLCRIRFAPNRTHGLALRKLSELIMRHKRESNLLFCVAMVLSVLCIATDITYYLCNDAKRIGHTAISLNYKICLSNILAVLSIIIINLSIHTLYVFVEVMFTGCSFSKIKALEIFIGNFVINGSYFFLSLGYDNAHTQPLTIMLRQSLHWLISLSYVLIAVTALEILFTMTMYKLFSTRIDFILGTEFFLWINSISTCFFSSLNDMTLKLIAYVDRSANIDYIWGESEISFDDDDNCDNRQDTNTSEHDSDMND
uniref:Uncharacterized protein n=1 Tax=Wuchereria bancrofti TaxID=6293 RepID=A0AAF5Q6F0_WUCBA